jgi:phenol 2-monooxygenase
LLFRLFDDSIKFNLGLGIDYVSSVLNVEPLTGTIQAGKRGPDCLLRGPGSQLPLRLFQLTKNMGAFSILIFAGQPLVTSSDIRFLREVIDRNELLETHPQALYRMLTIISGNAMNADAALGTKRFGNAYYDVDNSAHEKYGISINCGGIVVLRPDGILRIAANLNNWESIIRYFSAFMTT